jgi:hypothetical protein
MTTTRTTYVSLTELPTDDQTLRQVKAVVAYKNGVPASRVRARWNHPADKSHGATAEWQEERR